MQYTEVGIDSQEPGTFSLSSSLIGMMVSTWCWVGWSHQVDLSAVDRSLNSMKASAGLVSTLLLIPRPLGLIDSLKTQFWKLLPSMLSTGTLMVQFQSWSSYTIGVGYPSIFWMTYSSSLSILSAVLLASSSSFWEIDDLSITHIHCLVSTYP